MPNQEWTIAQVDPVSVAAWAWSGAPFRVLRPDGRVYSEHETLEDAIRARQEAESLEAQAAATAHFAGLNR